MKRLSLALSVVVLLLLVAGVGTAAAQTPTQDAGQLASSDQGAAGAAGTAQQQPTNRNVSVRVLSPGDDGPVSQTNEASSDATAGNLNTAEQDADQTQAGNGGLQTVGQSAESDQDALALALTLQQGASNENAPVRVLSEGDNGPVSQTNDASSEAAAGNTNVAEQDADQEQSGGTLCCTSDGSQAIGQSADSEQDAAAFSGTVQEKPSNSNISVRVLSPGDNGPVTQSNEASSDATAANLNATKQDADQDQGGRGCPCGHGGTQVVGQKAESDQDAKAGALTVQKGAENQNVDVRVLSPGDNGPVTQSNVASSNAAAGNTNVTKQDADQEQTGGGICCAAGTQIVGQAAKSDQDAAALAATIQEKPSNTNTPIRVLSPGDNGPVSQANVATSTALAGNLNVTKQDADQAQTGPGLQVIGQAAKNDQDAFALALTFQKGASNENAPVRVLSKGDDGPVSQLNHASSTALAGNTSWTEQDAEQIQGSPMTRGCCGLGIQAIGQLALSKQSAGALSATFQLGTKQPCRCQDGSGIGNTHDPVRVLSKGDGGPVRQANVATSTAHVANWDATKQKADQIQATPCVCLAEDIQAAGQLADSSQLAFGLAAVLQDGGHGHDPARTPQRKEVMHGIE